MRPAPPQKLSPGDAALARVRGKTVLIPLPATDFDPTEVAVPWQIFTAHGIDVVVDGNYVSARWPGDVHRFAGAVLGLLAADARG